MPAPTGYWARGRRIPMCRTRPATSCWQRQNESVKGAGRAPRSREYFPPDPAYTTMEVSVMNRFSALTMIVLVALALGASTALAQTTAPKPPPTYEQVIVNTWKNLHNKILAMAKDTEYPDAKLGWKPHPDSRSVLEELRHVTIGLEMTTAVAKGEKFDFGAREKMDAGKPA